MKFAGVDGCRLGWVYAGIADDDSFEVEIVANFAELGDRIAAAKLVLVDTPIGLPCKDIPDRLCDAAARKLISPRASTVFPAPARSALQYADYAAASAENFRCLGRKLSRQSFGIAAKIKDVDDFLYGFGERGKIREMHPEVAFYGLNGGAVITANKKTAQGFRQRFELLSRYFSATGALVEAARRAAPLKKDLQDDDILDALVGAVTARCNADLRTLPSQPIVDARGLVMEIVYAKRNPAALLV